MYQVLMLIMVTTTSAKTDTSTGTTPLNTLGSGTPCHGGLVTTALLLTKAMISNCTPGTMTTTRMSKVRTTVMVTTTSAKTDTSTGTTPLNTLGSGTPCLGGLATTALLLTKAMTSNCTPGTTTTTTWMYQVLMLIM